MKKTIKNIKSFDDIQIGDLIRFQWDKSYPVKICRVISRRGNSAEIVSQDGSHYLVIRGVHEKNLFLPDLIEAETERDDEEEMERLEAMEMAEIDEYQALVDMYTNPETGEIDWAEVYEGSYMYDM